MTKWLLLKVFKSWACERPGPPEIKRVTGGVLLIEKAELKVMFTIGEWLPGDVGRRTARSVENEEHPSWDIRRKGMFYTWGWCPEDS